MLQMKLNECVSFVAYAVTEALRIRGNMPLFVTHREYSICMTENSISMPRHNCMYAVQISMAVDVRNA